MPELPEVETVARDLRGLIVGATIVSAVCTWPRTLRTHDPESFDAAIAGRRIEAVGRRGKQLVVSLSGGAILTIHLKMTGQLFVGPSAEVRDPYVRLELGLADGREIRFRDIRTFGRIGLYPIDEATGEAVTEIGGTAVFAGTGPEPLDPSFTLRSFRERLRGRRGRLKSLLLDQSFIAGVGNIYADEALWTARVHPLRSAASLRRDDERRLHDAVRAILAEAVERRGSSVDDYTAPDGDGSMQEYLRVYQRTGEPCVRCGRPIRRVVVGGRATHFCSWCQRLPAADRRAAATILRTIVPGSAAAGGGEPQRRGRRWTELTGETPVGVRVAERDAARRDAAERERAARFERTRRAAAARRAAARSSAGGG